MTKMRTLAAVSFFVLVFVLVRGRGRRAAGLLAPGVLAVSALLPVLAAPASAKKPDAQALYQQGMAAGRGGDCARRRSF